MIRKNPYKSSDCEITVSTVFTKGRMPWLNAAHIFTVTRFPTTMAQRPIRFMVYVRWLFVSLAFAEPLK
jgi:hypothetical protein